ncbi:uncharacterized protein BDZ99DRAFT_520847 [Mytilinidion resinicola]|uniref:Putative lipoate-protein ligase A n=1 Tax=Mytilinidion resinicola TaxID=574789 RepID=A0A6A6YKU0_9PEZI|nr:uncharacterized protein BDZ99DRAFT_520847 [Mytilinidion resinicola]KAF2809492.1 hypothetical protein BDZ99DRAFT_520847 [Mytilinidion resinicola]
MIAPSRGIVKLQQASHKLLASGGRRSGHRGIASLAQTICDPIQSYVSDSNDPYLNLSIEHYLLQKSPPDSTILFLYTNRPCIVIGRNQNPWLEVNLGILKAGSSTTAKEDGQPVIGNVDLVRRRSGGGTVFHDEGNVNWSVICPPTDFTRDKHAEMVVRALRKLGIDRARVNERHDIVLDQGNRNGRSDPQDTHRTPYTVDDGAGPRPLKVSGSAYKLTRNRALHHGTCLLRSPNLQAIPQYLHSPAKPYLKARGVESVSSPIANIGLSNQAFQKQVQDEFARMHSGVPAAIAVDESLLSTPEISKGYDELRALDWTYSQTPQFTLFSHPETDEDPHAPVHDHLDTSPVPWLHPKIPINFKVQHGAILDVGSSKMSNQELEVLSTLKDQRIQELEKLTDELEGEEDDNSKAVRPIANWLGAMLPIVHV